jgi:hypothetical protein
MNLGEFKISKEYSRYKSDDVLSKISRDKEHRQIWEIARDIKKY